MFAREGRKNISAPIRLARSRRRAARFQSDLSRCFGAEFIKTATTRPAHLCLGARWPASSAAGSMSARVCQLQLPTSQMETCSCVLICPPPTFRCPFVRLSGGCRGSRAGRAGRTGRTGRESCAHLRLDCARGEILSRPRRRPRAQIEQSHPDCWRARRFGRPTCVAAAPRRTPRRGRGAKCERKCR